jgi:hypothetical protein
MRKEQEVKKGYSPMKKPEPQIGHQPSKVGDKPANPPNQGSGGKKK